jgi:hypothetical protein
MKAVSEIPETTQEPSEPAQNELGPIQLLVIGFNRTDLQTGETLDELAALEARGTIRVLDLLYVEKTGADELMIVDNVDLGPAASPFGGVLSVFLGLDGARPSGGGAIDHTLAGEIFGISGDQARASLEAMPEGTAAGIILFEHIWATHFRDAARRAGGYPVLQGFLTPEAILMIGEETRAIREAAIAIEVAQIVEGAALLDAVEAVVSAAAVSAAAEASAVEALEQATALEAYAAARAVRALIAAGVIEQYAAADAIDALRDAGLLLLGQTAQPAVAQ